MKQVTYTDEHGRRFATLLPDEEPEQNARRGVPVGPPPLGDLELPLATEVRLNNELFVRGLLRKSDIDRRPDEVRSAIMAALKVDMQRVTALYWQT